MCRHIHFNETSVLHDTEWSGLASCSYSDRIRDQQSRDRRYR